MLRVSPLSVQRDGLLLRRQIPIRRMVLAKNRPPKSPIEGRPQRAAPALHDQMWFRFVSTFGCMLLGAAVVHKIFEPDKVAVATPLLLLT